MATIPRAELMNVVGWVENVAFEGMQRHSKASRDMMSALTLVTFQDEKTVKTKLDVETVDEDFNLSSRPLLSTEFRDEGLGQMMLVGMTMDGAEMDVSGDGALMNAVEQLIRAKKAFGNKARQTLLRKMPLVSCVVDPNFRTVI